LRSWIKMLMDGQDRFAISCIHFAMVDNEIKDLKTLTQDVLNMREMLRVLTKQMADFNDTMQSMATLMVGTTEMVTQLAFKSNMTFKDPFDKGCSKEKDDAKKKG
jgi:hypothetical protein